MKADSGATERSQAILQVENLQFAYPPRVGASNETGADLRPSRVFLPSLYLKAGESLALLGASGSGKTTLLHLFAGLLTPDGGSIRVQGQPLESMRAAALDRFRGQHIGMVFQRLFLMPALSVRQNVALAQQLARVSRDDQRIDELLVQLGLAEVAHALPGSLSHGQAQRVAIARALVHRPVLVLADEPTSALDDVAAQAALTLLKNSASESGSALLLVTHDQRVRGQLDRDRMIEALQ